MLNFVNLLNKLFVEPFFKKTLVQNAFLSCSQEGKGIVK